MSLTLYNASQELNFKILDENQCCVIVAYGTNITISTSLGLLEILYWKV